MAGIEENKSGKGIDSLDIVILLQMLVGMIGFFFLGKLI